MLFQSLRWSCRAWRGGSSRRSLARSASAVAMTFKSEPMTPVRSSNGSGSCKDRNESFRGASGHIKPSLAKGQTGKTDPIRVMLQRLTGIQTLSQDTYNEILIPCITIRISQLIVGRRVQKIARVP